MKTKQIVERGPMTFCLELQKAVQDNWVIDEKAGDFNMFYDLFTIGMIKEEDTLSAHEGAVKKIGRPAKIA